MINALRLRIIQLHFFGLLSDIYLHEMLFLEMEKEKKNIIVGIEV